MSAIHYKSREGNPNKDVEKQPLMRPQPRSGDGFTPQGPEAKLKEKEKSLSIWRRIAIYFAFLVPLTAASAKAFTNSYSTLSIFIFFTMGVFVVNPALFTGPLLIVICALGIATILVSLNMEGRSLYEDLCNFIKPKKNAHKTSEEETPAQRLGGVADEPDALETYITSYLAYPFSWMNRKLGQRFPSAWKTVKEHAGPALALFMFLLSSATKGFAMAPGIFNILGLASCGPWAWLILALAVIAVMGVSAAKEGKKLLKQTGVWHQPNIKVGKGVSIIPTPYWKKWLVYSLSYFLPLVAAIAKAFGYSYGVLMLLAYIYTGSFAATAAVSAWMPLIIVVGVGLALVSLRMEGYALFKFFRRWFLSDDEIGLKTKYGIQDEFVRKGEKAIDDAELARKGLEIEAKLKNRPGWRRFERVTSWLFNYFIANTLPALAFLGKSSIMMVGTISAIVLLSGGMAITWWLLLIGAMAGLAVGLVSLQKEGKKTRTCVHKYYTLLMYKCFVDRKSRMQLPLFEDSYNLELHQRVESKQILPEGAGPSLLTPVAPLGPSTHLSFTPIPVTLQQLGGAF